MTGPRVPKPPVPVPFSEADRKGYALLAELNALLALRAGDTATADKLWKTLQMVDAVFTPDFLAASTPGGRLILIKALLQTLKLITAS